jgi:hypothetical protein
MRKNQGLWPQLCHDPVYRDPWRTEAENAALIEEIEEARTS